MNIPLMMMAWHSVLWLAAAGGAYFFPAEPLAQVATLITQ